MSRAKTQATQLGMSISTARARLVKQLLFRSLVENNKNVCFKCLLLIDNIDELSIEHVLPWEGRENGVELYWDLDNITFSHLGCNRPHINGAIKRRNYKDDKTAWCYACQTFKDNNLFDSCVARWNGLSSICKECKKNNDSRINHSKSYNYGKI